MAQTTVRITEETREQLRLLARESHESIQQILAKAVETYRRQRILEVTNAAYAAWKADPDQWAKERDERALWETALADGSA